MCSPAMGVMPALLMDRHDLCLPPTPTPTLPQVVDLIMMTTLGELGDGELDDDPLVVLGCGHALCTSTLDGCLHMEQYYGKEAGQGEGLTR